MSESMIGAVLYSKHEFRDLYHYFFVVVAEEGDELTIRRLREKEVDLPLEPGIHGWTVPIVPSGEGLKPGSPPSEWGKGRLTDSVRLVRRVGALFQDEHGQTYLRWAGSPKGYRYV